MSREDNHLSFLEQECSRKDDRIRFLEQESVRKEERIRFLEQDSVRKEERVRQLETERGDMQTTMFELKGLVESKGYDMRSMRMEMDEKERSLASMKSEKDAMAKTIQLLEDSKMQKEVELAKLKEEKQSTGGGPARERSRSPSVEKDRVGVSTLGSRCVWIINFWAKRRLYARHFNKPRVGLFHRDFVLAVSSVRLGDSNEWIALLEVEEFAPFERVAGHLKDLARAETPVFCGSVYLECRSGKPHEMKQLYRSELQRVKCTDSFTKESLSSINDYFWPEFYYMMRVAA